MNTLKKLTLLPKSDRIGIMFVRGLPLRRLYFSCLIFLAAILVWESSFGTRAYGATPESGPAASAISIVGKVAELNGAPLAAGTALFPGDVIRLGEASRAGFRFGDSLVLAAPLTELMIESRGVSLRDGRLQVKAGGREAFAISGTFFHVRIAASGGFPSSAEVRLEGKRAEISAVVGTAEVIAAGSVTPYKLHEGETASLDAESADASPGQGASSTEAGQVSRLVPQVQIDRASQHLVAAVSDRVFWNDDLRSGPTGRAHVTLKDGSQLNLGSDSNLRILQHDAQAQQTSLDLILGRMRGRITKMTRPGAKFEVHTPMGTAGLVGTDFSLLVTDDYTELMVFEGEVRFTTLNGQVIPVSAGNKVRISKAGVVDGPLLATAQEVQTAENLTDMTGPANQGAVAVASRPLAPLVITLTGTAAAVGIGVWQATRPTVSGVIP